MDGWTYAILGCCIFGIIGAFLFASQRIIMAINTVSKQEAQTVQTGDHIWEERIASVERRMAMLEEDAKTILLRASTRLNRAKAMSRERGDLDDSEEPEEARVGTQFRLPFTGSVSEDDPIEAVKAAMRDK